MNRFSIELKLTFDLSSMECWFKLNWNIAFTPFVNIWISMGCWFMSSWRKSGHETGSVLHKYVKRKPHPNPLSCREGEHEQRRCAEVLCHSLNVRVLRVICSCVHHSVNPWKSLLNMHIKQRMNSWMTSHSMYSYNLIQPCCFSAYTLPLCRRGGRRIRLS